MAELIPMEYRLGVAQRALLTRWGLAGGAVLALLAAGFSWAYLWQSTKAEEFEALNAVFRDRSVLIARSDELVAKRQSLAGRMGKIQQLMDDRTLVALLHKVADSRSDLDCLDRVYIDARGNTRGGDPASEARGYIVKVNGVTADVGSLAGFMGRLGKDAPKLGDKVADKVAEKPGNTPGNKPDAADRTVQPPLRVMLDQSKDERYLDGRVMRFQIVCEKPTSQG